MTGPRRPMLVSRYGISAHWASLEAGEGIDPDFDPMATSREFATLENLWRYRHLGKVTNDGAHRCVCPGLPTRAHCAQNATQEDLLCDQCREWCVGLDSNSVFVRLVDLYA